MFTGATFPLGPFEPYEGNPIMVPRGNSWESSNLYNPAAIVVDDEVVLLYRAHAADIISHIGLAHSRDGFTFDRHPEPVLSPSEDYDRYGCEDPRVAYIGGVYYLTYTGWDRRVAQLCLATSTDLRNWTKHGPVFDDFDTFKTIDPRGHNWSKAGVIVPVRIRGTWWMYFGEGGIYWATSEDLLHWVPGTSDDEPMYAPAPGTFEADLVEIGAAPVLSSNGLLVLLTNGATRTVHANGHVEVDYRCGQIAIDPDHPTEVLARMQQPWLRPQTAQDHTGLVPHVTFVEGLVHFGGKWLAYYGQADTTLAVAVHDPERRWGSALTQT